MANLYQINAQLNRLLEQGFDETCIDLDTGEIYLEKVQERLMALEIEEAVKIEGTALYIKNLLSDAAEIKAEEQALAERRKAKERKAEWLKRYISDYMQQQERKTFETARVAMSFRKSDSLVVKDTQAIAAFENGRFIEAQEPKVKVAEIKKAVKSGEVIPGVELIEKQNLQIK